MRVIPEGARKRKRAHTYTRAHHCYVDASKTRRGAVQCGAVMVFVANGGRRGHTCPAMGQSALFGHRSQEVLVGSSEKVAAAQRMHLSLSSVRTSPSRQGRSRTWRRAWGVGRGAETEG